VNGKNSARDIRQSLIDASKNAPKDAIRLRDVEDVTVEFAKGFELGAECLKARQKELTPERSRELMDGVGLSASLQSIFAPIQDAMKGFQASFVASLAEIDWGKVKMETEAYSALCKHLDAAINDELVQKSKSLLHLTEYIRSEIGKTGIGDTPAQFEFLVGAKVAEQLISESASKNAKSKNSEARIWVISKWKTHTSNPSNSKNKKAFSNRILDEIKSEFPDIKITAGQIETRWLPKNKPRKKV
jgi:hypothetical protein